jgi:general stress protein YciG
VGVDGSRDVPLSLTKFWLCCSVRQMDETKPRRPRGFAALCQTPEGRARVSEIARKGGKAAHEVGSAHEFSSDEAREAGRKGGRATHVKRRAAREAQAKPQEPQE